MSFNHGYLNNALLPTSGNGKRRWNDGEAGTPPANTGNENGNITTGNGSPWQAFKRLRVTHEDEDGDIFMNSPGRLFPPSAMHHSPPPQQQEQPQHEWGKHQTAGQETSSEHAMTTPVTHNPVQATSPDTDYHYVNHALGQLHQQRMERERRQAALQNQHYHDAAHQHHHHHHPMNARSPAVSRARSDSGSGSFHTPPTSRRKVVHLHTNSKLG
jgi:hypothetical protein